MAVGALVPRARWLLTCDVVAACATAAVVVPRPAEPQPRMAVVTVTLAITAAHLLQRHAYRGRHRLQALAGALAAAAMTDPLARLANRQGLVEALEQVLGRRSAADDAVPVEIAERLRELVREGDVTARLGGDELALVPDVGDQEAAVVAERARLRLWGVAGVLEQPWSVSIGRARDSVSTLDAAEDLLRRADLRTDEDERARRAAAAERAGAALAPGTCPTGG